MASSPVSLPAEQLCSPFPFLPETVTQMESYCSDAPEGPMFAAIIIL